MTEVTYREAIRQALIDAMQADPSVILIGEEVGSDGVTRGLIDRFGANRVIDAPISEPAIVGAALTRLRPVAERMYVGFIA